MVVQHGVGEVLGHECVLVGALYLYRVDMALAGIVPSICLIYGDLDLALGPAEGLGHDYSPFAACYCEGLLHGRARGEAAVNRREKPTGELERTDAATSSTPVAAHEARAVTEVGSLPASRRTRFTQ